MALTKKTKSVLISLGLILLFVFSGISMVSGDGAQGNGDSYPGGNLGNCGGSNCIWSGHVGVRFSLVDENGKKVSGTSHIDLWMFNNMSKSFYSSYDLYDNSNVLLWNFNGAWYGDQIKQDVFAGAAGLKSGQYFQKSGVYNLTDVLVGFSGSYTRWEASFAHTVAEWVRANTSNEKTTAMDSLLTKMGYSGSDGVGPTIAAANANYYLQYEPVIANGRVGSSITNYIFVGTPTEYAKYDEAKAGVRSPWLSNGTTGVFIYRAGEGEAPSNFTTGTGSGVANLLLKDGNGKIYGEGVAHIWLRDVIDIGIGCVEAVDYINATYTPGTSEYNAQLAKVMNGTFEYKASDGSVKKILQAYTFDNLYEENYSKLPSKQAACTNNKVISQTCDEAIEYINSNYTIGSNEYHNAVAQVRNGTFRYETIVNGILQTKKIDKAYNDPDLYAMLVKEIYTRKGGKAACEPVDITCDFEGADVLVDDCITGKTFFGDIDNEEAWLVCEIAYTNDGTIYSSDNTGHDAVETTNGGIVGNAEYCEVFCYENFETHFPTNVRGVRAGQTFTWGSSDGTFGTVKVKKECSNQSYIKGKQGYRFEEWEEDYIDNEQAMIRYYMRKASYEKMLSKIKTDSDWIYTSCWKCSTCKSENGGSYECNCRYTCRKRYSGTATASGSSHSYYHSYVDNVKGSVTDERYSTGYSYTSPASAKAAAKSQLESILKGLAASEEALYTGKKSDEAELLVKIRQCTNNLEYLYKTMIQFTFSEPINEAYGANTRNFSFDDKLLVSGDFNTNNVDTSKCKVVKSYSYTCTGFASGASCTPKVEKVLDCTIVTWDLTGNYKYSYPVDEFQWYSLKTDSTLINGKDKMTNTEDDAFFYSIGFGLPTALSLTNGEYELKVTVGNIGDNAETEGAQDYNIPDGHFAPLATEVNIGGTKQYGFEYACIYEVENEIFGYDCRYDQNGNLIYISPEYCDEEEDDDSNGSLVGIDVAYRLVTLLSDGDTIYKAFPGISGNGRVRGNNWQLSYYTLHRILDADVYETNQAMYEIMLDVNAIQRIREDNQDYFDGGKDPYTSYYDENKNQKVYCVTNENQVKYCASDFISDLYTGKGLNYRLLGTCLPMSNTLGRAEYILANGCDTTYQYPEINWMR